MDLQKLLAAAVLGTLTACTTLQSDQSQSLGPQQGGGMGDSATGCVETVTSTCMRTDGGGAGGTDATIYLQPRYPLAFY